MNAASSSGDRPDGRRDAPLTIRTSRLELLSLTTEFVAALSAGDASAAEREIGVDLSPWLPGRLAPRLQRRWREPSRAPGSGPWLGWAMVLTENDGRRVIGIIDLMDAPDERGRVEVGFVLDPAYRRRGLATEALTAVFDWATSRHGVTRVTALVAPQDDRAVRLATRLTFREVGPELEEVDGLELVLEADWSPARETERGGKARGR